MSIIKSLFYRHTGSLSVFIFLKKEIRSPHLFLHSDLPIKQDEYFNHRRPSLRKRYLMKTSLAYTPYSACLQQWMLRFKAVSAWCLYGMNEDSAFLPLLGRLHRGLTSLLPHQCPRQPEMDLFSIRSLRVSAGLCPGLSSCDDSEPLGPEHVLNSPSSTQSTTMAVCHCFSHVWPKQVT